MDCYMTLWAGGTAAGNTSVACWKLSAALLKKHYGNVTLVADSAGAAMLSDVQFDAVETVLDELVPEYPVYTAGKVYAWRHIASKGRPFLHVDGDAFLWAPLEEQVLSQPVVVQSEDWNFWESSSRINTHDYNIAELERLSGCVIPQEWRSLIDDRVCVKVYNTGIFGGYDLGLISRFCDYAIGVMEDERYKPMWQCPECELGSVCLDKVKSMMAEQGALGIFLRDEGVVPGMVFQHRGDIYRSTYGRYTHLMNMKQDPAILARVEARVASIPYDLEPRLPEVERWHLTSPLADGGS